MRTPKSPTLSLSKISPQSRLFSKFNSHNSLSTSLSSCSSMANLTNNCKGSKQYPKLFKEENSMLFSFNPAKNSKSIDKNLHSNGSQIGKHSGQTTAFSSLHMYEERDSFIPFKKTQHSSSTYQAKKKTPTDHDSKREDRIKVFIRIKPSVNEASILTEKPFLYRVDEKHLEIEGKVLAYDYIFPTQAKQEDVFKQVAQPILDNVLSGNNGTMFAYGQTGSGKTYTIFGGNTSSSFGIIYRSVHYLFSKKTADTEISMTLMEIYKEDLIDLFCPGRNQLKLKENGGVFVEGLTNIKLEDPEETLHIISLAQKNRRTATTLLNQKSSRSHTFLTLNLVSAKGSSKLCLIDLAGSQKVNKAGVTGEALEETKKINFSLSCLGNVINALVTRKKSDHIPFRDSKLTRLLKDSLTGKFMTSLVVNCSSDEGTEQESVSSLKFADRAKKIKVTISRNTGNKANLEYYQNIIKKLSSQLETTKEELHRYKQIYESKLPGAQPQNKKQSPEITARQTIPSERLNVDEKMRKYGKQNKLITIVSSLPKVSESDSSKSNFLDLSSLNVSHSVRNQMWEINSPTMSTLTRRAEEGGEDFSFNFSIQKESFRE